MQHDDVGEPARWRELFEKSAQGLDAPSRTAESYNRQPLIARRGHCIALIGVCLFCVIGGLAIHELGTTVWRIIDRLRRDVREGAA